MEVTQIRDWKHVVLELELPDQRNIVELRVNVAKSSFWGPNCHELISKRIGKWLIEQQLAPWPKGSPPVLEVVSRGEGRFRVRGCRHPNEVS
jgi:hypothetical protein